MDIVIAFLLGTISSLVIWILTTQIFSPKIKFSKHICRYCVDVDKKNIQGYEFKICNTGSRNIFDINVYFNIRIKGLIYPDIYEHFIIPVGNNKNTITLLKPSKHGLTMSINADWLILIDKKYFPDYIIEKSKTRQLTLDDLYVLGTDVYSEISLSGYDSFTGTKKHFCSQQYRIEDFSNGEFDFNSLNVNQIETTGTVN